MKQTQLATEVTRRGGAASRPGGIGIRPAYASDCAAIQAFVTGLSPRARFLRFFGPAAPPAPSVLRGLCGAGLTTDVLVATGEPRDGQNAHQAIVGHAMAADSLAPDGGLVTDVGLVVADRWQRHGVGSDLLGRLAARAQARGVRMLVMDVLPENRPMLAMTARLWPGAAYGFGPDAVTIRVRLAGPPAAGISPAAPRSPAGNGVPAADGGYGGAALRAA